MESGRDLQLFIVGSNMGINQASVGVSNARIVLADGRKLDCPKRRFL